MNICLWVKCWDSNKTVIEIMFYDARRSGISTGRSLCEYRENVLIRNPAVIVDSMFPLEKGQVVNVLWQLHDRSATRMSSFSHINLNGNGKKAICICFEENLSYNVNWQCSRWYDWQIYQMLLVSWSLPWVVWTCKGGATSGSSNRSPRNLSPLNILKSWFRPQSYPPGACTHVLA